MCLTRIIPAGAEPCYYTGTSNRNGNCDYSSAYVSLYTDSSLVGHGMTFTIGRGNDIVSLFIFFFIFLVSRLRAGSGCDHRGTCVSSNLICCAALAS